MERVLSWVFQGSRAPAPLDRHEGDKDEGNLRDGIHDVGAEVPERLLRREGKEPEWEDGEDPAADEVQERPADERDQRSEAVRLRPRE